MNENALINAIVTAVRMDLSHGKKKEDIMRVLSIVINRDLFIKVRDRLQ
jgi:hypothetical protein